MLIHNLKSENLMELIGWIKKSQWLCSTWSSDELNISMENTHIDWTLRLWQHAKCNVTGGDKEYVNTYNEWNLMKDIHKRMKGYQLQWIKYPLWQKNGTRGSGTMSVPNWQGHILPGGGQRQRNGMIRTDICTQSTRPHTSWRWTKMKG